MSSISSITLLPLPRSENSATIYSTRSSLIKILARSLIAALAVGSRFGQAAADMRSTSVCSPDLSAQINNGVGFLINPDGNPVGNFTLTNPALDQMVCAELANSPGDVMVSVYGPQQIDAAIFNSAGELQQSHTDLLPAPSQLKTVWATPSGVAVEYYGKVSPDSDQRENAALAYMICEPSQDAKDIQREVTGLGGEDYVPVARHLVSNRAEISECGGNNLGSVVDVYWSGENFAARVFHARGSSDTRDILEGALSTDSPMLASYQQEDGTIVMVANTRQQVELLGVSDQWLRLGWADSLALQSQTGVELTSPGCYMGDRLVFGAHNDKGELGWVSFKAINDATVQVDFTPFEFDDVDTSITEITELACSDTGECLVKLSDGVDARIVSVQMNVSDPSPEVGAPTPPRDAPIPGGAKPVGAPPVQGTPNANAPSPGSSKSPGSPDSPAAEKSAAVTLRASMSVLGVFVAALMLR